MSREDSKRRFVCVWLDDQSNQSKHFIEAQQHIQNHVDSFRHFNQLHKCLDFLFNMDHVYIIFITLDRFAQEIIPLVHSSQQIYSIYIFTSKTSIDKQWIKDYHKVKGIFHDMNLLYDNINGKISNPTKSNHIGLSFLSSDDINTNDMKRQDPAFMYFQLLKDIILNDNDKETEEETKTDMLTYCRHKYATNKKTLEILNEFEENFLPELSIYWYTRECFLYKMLNKALWSPEPDVLYKLRYFIRHPHQQIINQSELQRNNRGSITVYRGQMMTIDEIEKLKENVDGYLSFNNFLSTSLKRQIALKFIDQKEDSVLFEINIDTKINKFPFANIEHLSYQQGKYDESELLFSMGTVFKIVRIKNENDYTCVKLMISDDIDQQLAQYSEHTRKQIRSPHSFLSLLKLMNQLSIYNYIDRFAEIFDDENFVVTNILILDNIHNVFGLMYNERGQWKQSLKHYEKSLNICLNYLSANHPRAAVIYNNIGYLHSSQLDYEKALTYYQLALDCQTNAEDNDNSLIITYTNNIATIYDQQQNYNQALVYYKRVLQLQKDHLGENDLSLIKTYNSISTVYYKLDDYQNTCLYHEKALSLEKDTSQLNPEASVSASLTNGNLCLVHEQYQDALDHFNRALKIQKQYFLPNHPSLASTYDSLAKTYYQQNQYERSLSCHMKSLTIEENSLSDDHPAIAEKYSSKAIEQLKKSSQNDINTLIVYIDHQAHISYQQDQYENALTYSKQALELALTYLSENDASLIRLYYRMANVYLKLEVYNKALHFYEKTLNIELETLPDNARTIATTYMDIATVYIAMEQFDHAFNAVEKSYNQLIKTLPHNHPDVVQCRSLLDRIKIRQIIDEEKNH